MLLYLEITSGKRHEKIQKPRNSDKKVLQDNEETSIYKMELKISPNGYGS